eukprot:NODE_6_length_70510_cov_1.054395.p58 type:complete len:112 gc:universal NODE_6_length_70510_cov_1.054395:7305-6970(-)
MSSNIKFVLIPTKKLKRLARIIPMIIIGRFWYLSAKDPTFPDNKIFGTAKTTNTSPICDGFNENLSLKYNGNTGSRPESIEPLHIVTSNPTITLGFVNREAKDSFWSTKSS